MHFHYNMLSLIYVCLAHLLLLVDPRIDNSIFIYILSDLGCTIITEIAPSLPLLYSALFPGIIHDPDADVCSSRQLENLKLQGIPTNVTPPCCCSLRFQPPHPPPPLCSIIVIITSVFCG